MEPVGQQEFGQISQGNQAGSNISLTRVLVRKIINTILRQAVLCTAIFAALITCFLVPVDREYLSYFDIRTLLCLFTTLAVVSAFDRIHIFEFIGKKLVTTLGNLRRLVLGIVFLTFLSSMLLANDMALITFLPLGAIVLSFTGKEKYMTYLFILQNIAANLGGMITPFGNPQNLYLYSFYQIPVSEFFSIMFPSFLLALLLIAGGCLIIRPEPLQVKVSESYTQSRGRIILYSLLFLLSILIVFRVVSLLPGTIVVILTLLIADRKAFQKVNYPLLLTFCAFFVFAGNMARITAVQNFFEMLLQKNTFLFGILSCQFISNVPSAVLLSQFTTDYQSLLLAVNLGGLGTLIASLASLITFSEFRKNQPGHEKKYLFMFSAVNAAFLILLVLFEFLWKFTSA